MTDHSRQSEDREQLQVPALKMRLAEVTAAKIELAAQVARAQARIGSHAAEAARQENVLHFCRLALRGLDKLAPEGRQRLLQALIKSTSRGKAK
jgi:hypothetical protein